MPCRRCLPLLLFSLLSLFFHCCRCFFIAIAAFLLLSMFYHCRHYFFHYHLYFFIVVTAFHCRRYFHCRRCFSLPCCFPLSSLSFYCRLCYLHNVTLLTTALVACNAIAYCFDEKEMRVGPLTVFICSPLRGKFPPFSNSLVTIFGMGP